MLAVCQGLPSNSSRNGTIASVGRAAATAAAVAASIDAPSFGALTDVSREPAIGTVFGVPERGGRRALSTIVAIRSHRIRPDFCYDREFHEKARSLARAGEEESLSKRQTRSPVSRFHGLRCAVVRRGTAFASPTPICAVRRVNCSIPA